MIIKNFKKLMNVKRNQAPNEGGNIDMGTEVSKLINQRTGFSDFLKLKDMAKKILDAKKEVKD